MLLYVPTPECNFVPSIVIPEIEPSVRPRSTPVSPSCRASAPKAAPAATVFAAVPPIVTPLAIEPDVAVIAPVMVALVAVKAPALLTLNGAEANVLWPK